MGKRVGGGFGLTCRRGEPRVTGTKGVTNGRTYHALRVTSAEDIDEQVRDWLTESYLQFSG